MAWKPITRRNEQNRRESRRLHDLHRGSARERGYDSQWDAFSKRYRQENPLCMDCLEEGRATPSEHVHHIRKLREHPELKYDESNLRGLCETCHNKRTAKGE